MGQWWEFGKLHEHHNTNENEPLVRASASGDTISRSTRTASIYGMKNTTFICILDNSSTTE